VNVPLGPRNEIKVILRPPLKKNKKRRYF